MGRSAELERVCILRKAQMLGNIPRLVSTRVSIALPSRSIGIVEACHSIQAIAIDHYVLQ